MVMLISSELVPALSLFVGKSWLQAPNDCTALLGTEVSRRGLGAQRRQRREGRPWSRHPGPAAQQRRERGPSCLGEASSCLSTSLAGTTKAVRSLAAYVYSCAFHTAFCVGHSPRGFVATPPPLTFSASTSSWRILRPLSWIHLQIVKKICIIS